MLYQITDGTVSAGGHVILSHVDFEIKGNEKIALVGRNGAGKTTTIRIIMDVFHADEGQVLLDGAPFVYQPGQVGYLPEERGLYPKRLISEQLVYLAKLRGMNKKQAEENMRKWLTRLDVIQYENRKLDTLSKGNQQKVQLAATLVADPDIVILDEPFSGLDPVNSQILKDVINERIADGKIVVMSTQVMYEGSDMEVYEVGHVAKERYGLIEAYDMTLEATVTKLMWIMAQTKDPQKIKAMFYTTINHDILFQ